MSAHVNHGRWLPRLAAILLVMAACGGASTTIEQSWTAPEARLGELRNVVTLYVSSDGAMRRTVEDAMSQQLARAGVRVTPSYTFLRDDELLDRARAKATLVAAGFDGVIGIRLVSREQELAYIPGTFDGYWGPAWSAAYDPGYLVSETVVRVETSAYSLTSNQLVWSALSRTVDPNGPREVIDDITQVAATELRKQGIVARAAVAPGAM